MLSKNRKIFSLSYTLRRYYVDEFYSRNINLFEQGSIILDIGGKKKNKRGYFNIENYPVSVKYANLDITTEPDFLCDVTNVPAPKSTFDGVVCSEVLEHVPDPKKVLEEAFRVLRPGGVLLVCVPFLFRVHPDPYDFGRYTGQYWQTVLEDIGFKNTKIECQGLFFSVASDMLTGFAYQMEKEGNISGLKRWFIRKLAVFGKRKAFELDRKQHFKNHPFFNSYTAGYGIIAFKPT